MKTVPIAWLMGSAAVAGSEECSCKTDLLARFDGDAVLLEEVAREFLERSVALEESLRAELVTGNASAAARAAHTLKGLIAYFDRGIVFNIARQIEFRADAGDLAGAKALLDSLRAFVEHLRDSLRQDVCSVGPA